MPGLSSLIQNVLDVAKIESGRKAYAKEEADLGRLVADVIEVMRQIGEEMLEDPDLKQSIEEPLNVLGVNRLDDSAVTIRARLKTVAGMQWSLRREFLRRVKNRFDEVGIEIPFPHQTVYFGVDKDGAAPPVHVRLSGSRGSES